MKRFANSGSRLPTPEREGRAREHPKTPNTRKNMGQKHGDVRNTRFELAKLEAAALALLAEL